MCRHKDSRNAALPGCSQRPFTWRIMMSLAKACYADTFSVSAELVGLSHQRRSDVVVVSRVRRAHTLRQPNILTKTRQHCASALVTCSTDMAGLSAGGADVHVARAQQGSTAMKRATRRCFAVQQR